YKFLNPEGLYFVSFATVYWIDVFIRELYFSIVTDSLNFCHEHKGMKIYCWCIMPSHIHLIFQSEQHKPEILLGKLKEYTSKRIQETIRGNPTESRKEWLLWMFERAGSKSSNVKHSQLWQHHNHPVELWSIDVIEQKVSYIHNNPVVSGFVTQPEHWKYSSAYDYAGGKGLVKVDLLW